MSSLNEAMNRLKKSKKLSENKIKEATKRANARSKKLSEAIKEAKIIKESWAEAYKEFEAIVDKYDLAGPNVGTRIQAEVDKLYDSHKGEKDWDEAYRRWILVGDKTESKDLKEEVEIEVDKEEIITDPDNVEIVEEGKIEEDVKNTRQFEYENIMFVEDGTSDYGNAFFKDENETYSAILGTGKEVYGETRQVFSEEEIKEKGPKLDAIKNSDEEYILILNRLKQEDVYENILKADEVEMSSGSKAEEKGRLIEFEIKNEAYYQETGDGAKRAIITSGDSGTVTVVEVEDEEGTFYIVGINHPERDFEDVEVEQYLSKEKAEEAAAEVCELIEKYEDLDELGYSFDFNTNNIYEKIAKKVRSIVKTDMNVSESKVKPKRESKVTDINEKSFNKLLSQFVKENFKNAKNIRIKSVSESKEGLKLEAVLNYKSGNTAPIVFEVKGRIKEGKSTVKIFENKIFKNENVERPIMIARLNTEKGMAKLEKLKYDFNTTLKEGKVANVYGVING